MVVLGERIHNSDRELKKQLLLHRLFDFLKPPKSFNEEAYLTEVCAGLNRYDTVLIVGRFQPLHYGHMLLMKLAARISSKIIIGIGSANKLDKDNPFPVGEREKWLRQQLNRNGLNEDKVKIVRLDDCGNDERWGRETLSLTGRVDAVIGNNEHVNGIFRQRGIKVVTTPFFVRGIYKGQYCREDLDGKGLLPQIV